MGSEERLLLWEPYLHGPNVHGHLYCDMAHVSTVSERVPNSRFDLPVGGHHPIADLPAEHLERVDVGAARFGLLLRF